VHAIAVQESTSVHARERTERTRERAALGHVEGWAVGTAWSTDCPGFQHTLAESWASQPVEAKLVSLFRARRKVARVDVRALDGASRDSRRGFLVLGDSETQICLVHRCQPTTNIASPLPENVDV